jgi:hypothetical protein
MLYAGTEPRIRCLIGSIVREQITHTPSSPGPQHGFLLRSSVSRHVLYFCATQSAWPQTDVRKTYQCLRNSYKPSDFKLILTEIQNFQCSVALQHLGDVSYPGLQRFNTYSSSVTHSRLTRISLPLRSRVLRAPSRGRASSALTLSSRAALGP